MIFRYLRPDAPVSQLFCLFTQVHHLIDGSVEGQYVTPIEYCDSFVFLSLQSFYHRLGIVGRFGLHECHDAEKQVGHVCAFDFFV